jgi:hypothetical protein
MQAIAIKTWILLDGVRRSFRVVNHDLRENVVLFIVGKQFCNYTCVLVPTFIFCYIFIITFYILMYFTFVFYIPGDDQMVGQNI